jgi:hypothetical protein
MEPPAPGEGPEGAAVARRDALVGSLLESSALSKGLYEVFTAVDKPKCDVYHPELCKYLRKRSFASVPVYLAYLKDIDSCEKELHAAGNSGGSAGSEYVSIFDRTWAMTDKRHSDNGGARTQHLEKLWVMQFNSGGTACLLKCLLCES